MSESDIIADFPAQGSGEWLRQRTGKITASRFDDATAKLKSGKPSKTRENYLMEIVIEIITGVASDHYTSAAMQWGIDNEAAAVRAYEAKVGAFVERVGFIPHPSIGGVGASPDGYLARDGGMEVKCPYNPANHVRTLLDGMPDEHIAQVQGGMWCSGRAWWDFVSYDPRMPAPFDLYVKRVERDDAYIDNLAAEIVAFRGEVDAMLERLGWKAQA